MGIPMTHQTLLSILVEHASTGEKTGNQATGLFRNLLRKRKCLSSRSEKNERDAALQNKMDD
jgi:hypothetical protein